MGSADTTRQTLQPPCLPIMLVCMIPLPTLTLASCATHEWSDKEWRATLLQTHAISEADTSSSPRDAQVRLFQPKARIYFDLKKNRSQRPELDIFDDGSLVPTISLLEVYYPNPFPTAIGNKSWSYGPALGFGLSSPADPGSSTQDASSAPVLLLSLGLQAEIPISEVRTDSGDLASTEAHLAQATKLGIELGLAVGFSADESLSDTNDTAIYAGFTFKF